jgi:DNA-binding MarR family transcriptional regulator
MDVGAQSGGLDQALLQRLVGLLLKSSRWLDLITRQLAPKLNITESHLLYELVSQPNSSASDLSKQLHIGKSTVSRSLAALRGKGLVEMRVTGTDRRFKQLLVTDRGREELKADINLRNEQVREFSRRLSAREQAEVCQLLRLLADAFQAPLLSQNSEDEPLKVQIRRLTRVMGFLSNDALGTGLSVEWCHVLYLAGLEEQGISLKRLDEMLPFDKSMTSRLVSTMQAKRWVSKLRLGTDRRAYMVCLTPGGIKRRFEMLSQASASLEAAISKLPADYLPRALDLFEILLPAAPEREMVRSHEPAVRSLKSEEERKLGRAFLIEQIFRQGLQYETPEVLLGKGSLSFALYYLGEIVALLEIVKDGQQAKVQNFICKQASLPQMVKQLLLVGLEAAVSRYRVRKIFSESKPCLEAFSELHAGTQNGTYSFDIESLLQLLKA